MSKKFALDVTKWLVDRILRDFEDDLPVGVRVALRNVLDLIAEEHHRG